MRNALIPDTDSALFSAWQRTAQYATRLRMTERVLRARLSEARQNEEHLAQFKVCIERGYAAGLKGERRSTNPWPEDIDHHTWWEMGWQSGEYERQKAFLNSVWDQVEAAIDAELEAAGAGAAGKEESRDH